MDYNEIIDYNGELIILNSENAEIKPMIKSCQVKQLRHQESIILENYMDTVILHMFISCFLLIFSIDFIIKLGYSAVFWHKIHSIRRYQKKSL